MEQAGLLKCLKKPVLEHWLAVNMLKRLKDCLNQHGTIFLIFFLTLLKKIRSKKYVLVVSEILRLFVSILTPDGKYSVSVKPTV